MAVFWECEACTNHRNRAAETRCNICNAARPANRVAVRVAGVAFLCRRARVAPSSAEHPWRALRLDRHEQLEVTLPGDIVMDLGAVRGALRAALAAAMAPARKMSEGMAAVVSLALAEDEGGESGSESSESEEEEDDERPPQVVESTPETDAACAMCDDELAPTEPTASVSFSTVVDQRRAMGRPVPKRDPRMRSFGALYEQVDVCGLCARMLGVEAGAADAKPKPKRRASRRASRRVKELAQPKPRDPHDLAPLPQKPFLRRGDGESFTRALARAASPPKRGLLVCVGQESPSPEVVASLTALAALPARRKKPAAKRKKKRRAKRRLTPLPDSPVVQDALPPPYAPLDAAPRAQPEMMPVLEPLDVRARRARKARALKARTVMGDPYLAPLRVM